MEPSIVAALGGAAVNQGASLLDGYLTRRYNERQIDKQWARSLEQWNRENAYNHPAAVVARLKSAGVNPALAYMNGASFASAATSPTPEANHSQKLFQPQLDPMMVANIRLMQSQADKNVADAEEARSRIPTYEKQIEQMDKYIEFLGSQSALFASQTELNKVYGEKVGQEIYSLQIENERNSRAMEDTLRRIKSEADAAEYNASKMKIELDQYAEQLELQRKNLRAQAYAAIQSGRLSSAQCDKVRAEIERYDEVVNAQLGNLRSSTDLNYANARESGARAATEDAMRDSRVKLSEKEARYAGFKAITEGSARVISASAQLVSAFKPGINVTKVEEYVNPAGASVLNSMFD